MCLLKNVQIFQGEVAYWSLLGVKGLITNLKLTTLKSFRRSKMFDLLFFHSTFINELVIVHQYEFVLSKDTFFGALHFFVNCCEAKSLWIELLCHSKYSNWLVKQNISKWFGAFKKWIASVPETLVMSYIDSTSPMNHLRCTWCKVSACSNWGAAHCPSQSIEVFLDFLRM